MITDKQRQRDYEYEADYQSRSKYTGEQWKNILESGTLEEDQMSLLKGIYTSYNHASTLLKLAFEEKSGEDKILERLNDAGRVLGEANDLEPETDYEGNDYWWYLLCWGKNTPDSTLELKLHPELTEAIGMLFPEMEEAYYAFVNDVDRSLQIRYNQEDSVWIAAAVLLYEKYYRYPGISTDDILLMQYEVQTRAQKVFGQDVNTNTITQICNADERGHRFNYLRDIYKYYRVSYPGEFEGDRERPEEENLDYHAYVNTIFGYVPLTVITDFIDHEYDHMFNESYIEMNQTNGFVRIAALLGRHGGEAFSLEDKSETALSLRADGEDADTTFHMLADSLCREYPNFTYAKKASWLDKDKGLIAREMCDVLHIENYSHCGASIAVQCIPDGDGVNVLVSLNLPEIPDQEAMADIRDKCSKLTLMTAAPFKVEEIAPEINDLKDTGRKIRASVLYPYDEFKQMNEENLLGLMSTSLQIFASYYTDICHNYYPPAEEDSDQDPLAAALGSKLVYRQPADVPPPQVIYKEGPETPTADFVQKALQNYDMGSSRTETGSGSSFKSSGGDREKERISAPPKENKTSPSSGRAYEPEPVIHEPKVPMSEHPERAEQGFRLYPKNTLIKGPLKTGKYHEAITTAVGIIEGKDRNTVNLDPVPDILEAYRNYVDSGKIMHVSYPDICGDGYEGWIEGRQGSQVRDGIFKEFANRCAGGRYVVMMEEVDLNWMHLFGETAVLLRENRRQGTSSETCITLRYSKEPFRLPSNLYIVATCDSVVGEDTIFGAIGQDFFVRNIAPDSSILKGIRVEGISLERLMATINLRLSYFLGSDYQLGEGFYLATPDPDPFTSLSRVFREQIIPLMEKWLDDDLEKIRYVLGDNAKSRADTVFYQEIPFRDTMFKGSLPDSFDTGRCIYRINEDAFKNPRSYISVYE